MLKVPLYVDKLKVLLAFFSAPHTPKTTNNQIVTMTAANKASLDVFKDIPGYKAILKAVLKNQIQMLVSTSAFMLRIHTRYHIYSAVSSGFSPLK